jgi:F-type H+/Na+-transporting ATPase subunit alpha
VEREVVSVWAGNTGQVDEVPVEDISRFEAEFLDHVQRVRPGIYDAIRETGDLSEDTITALKEVIDDFKRTFETSSGELLVKEVPVDALGEEDVGQEKITRYVPPKVEQE